MKVIRTNPQDILRRTNWNNIECNHISGEVLETLVTTLMTVSVMKRLQANQNLFWQL